MELIRYENAADPEVQARYATDVDSSKRKKFLVVEDDYTVQPFWEQIIQAVSPNAIIRWATTEEGAEKQIRDRLKIGDKFDLVITDIFLAGQKNGIDLWKRYGDAETLFVFSSVIRPNRFEAMIGDVGGEPPLLLKKPLDSKECIETLRAIIAYRQVFS